MRFAMRLVLSLVVALSPAPVAAVQPPQASVRDQLIVSTDWLASHLRDPDLVLLQIGGTDADFRAGHIPGAQRARTWRNSPADADGFNEMMVNGLLLEMLPDADLPAILARHGITARSRVVIYFAAPIGLTASTRLMLTLEHAGLGDRVSLLQGGLPQWKREGRAMSVETPTVAPAAPMPLRFQPVVVDAAFVQANTGKPSIVIVDGREPAVYDGVPVANRSAPKEPPGHVPGAINIAHESLYDSDGRLKPEDELRSIFAAAGIRPGDTIVGYCYTGQRVTAVLLAARTLGYKTMLYDGSAEDWAARKLPFTTAKK